MTVLAVGSPLTEAPPDRQPAQPAQRAPGVDTSVRAVAHWPVTPVTVVRPFEPHEQFGPGHRGVDLAALPGQSVRSALAGRVTFSGEVAGRPVVVIEHEGGLRTTYLPVASTVAVGSFVAAGQHLGSLTPSTHCPVSSCLHWGAWRDGAYLDPLTLLRQEVVLLPP